MIIKKYTYTETLTLKCSFYRNPVYRQIVSGFRLEISDQEGIANTILETQTWTLDASADADLVVQTLDSSALNFDFYMNREETSVSQVPIQFEVGLSIDFTMPIPTEKSSAGCFMKIKFPNDITLPDPDDEDTKALIFQTLDNNMMTKSTGQTSLSAPDEVFQRQQLYSTDVALSNILIFKGCSYVAGNVLSPFIKITNLISPFAVKTTGTFTIDLYKSFNEVDYSLSNHIATGSGEIDSSKFTSGQLTNGKFSASIDFIQVSAQHTLQFTLANALPKSDDYTNRIVIMMPDIMSASPNDPSIKNLDGKVKQAQIKRLTTKEEYAGCESRVCYEITYLGTNSIPTGSTLQFVVGGTNNQ